MANCKDCIHYEPCFEYGNILDPIHGGVKCDSFKPTADVVPKSEADEIAEELSDTIVMKDELFDEVVKLRGELANVKKEVAMEIFEAVLDVYKNTCDADFEEEFADLKKKYTEDEK